MATKKFRDVLFILYNTEYLIPGWGRPKAQNRFIDELFILFSTEYLRSTKYLSPGWGRPMASRKLRGQVSPVNRRTSARYSSSRMHPTLSHINATDELDIRYLFFRYPARYKIKNLTWPCIRPTGCLMTDARYQARYSSRYPVSGRIFR